MVNGKHQWGTWLNDSDDEKLQEFVEFLYESRELDTKSRYGAVKYLLCLAYDVLYDDRLIKMMELLHENKMIKKRTLLETFHYALLLANQKIKEVLG